jgi:Radical SAM superfamily
MKFWIVNITSFCNQKCIFCSEWDMHNDPKHIRIEKVFSILMDLKKNWVEGINFMWWECTLRSDLWEILDFCNEHFKIVSIVTNGVMFSNKKWCETILWKINSFEFSWHTNNEDKFDYLSWSKTYQLFQKSLKHISEFLENNQKLWITINHVINKVNYMDIPDFVADAISQFPLQHKKNRMIALKRTNLIWYSLKNSADLSVCPSDVLPYLYTAIDLCIQNNVNVQIEWFPPCYFQKFLSSELFLVNEMEKSDLYLLNKLDIALVDDVTSHKQNEMFHSDIYLKWNIELNIQILQKCKKCFFRKKCHDRILFWHDSNNCTPKIINYIGHNLVTLEDFKFNMLKRNIFTKNTQSV